MSMSPPFLFYFSLPDADVARSTQHPSYQWHNELSVSEPTHAGVDDTTCAPRERKSGLLIIGNAVRAEM
jgi:hypothetical protein